MDPPGDWPLRRRKLAQSLDDFGGGRKAAGAVPRINEFAAGSDIEHAGASLDEFGFTAECAFDFGRQTGGLRQIVSSRAVGDGNLHGVFRVQGFMRLEPTAGNQFAAIFSTHTSSQAPAPVSSRVSELRQRQPSGARASIR